MALVVLMTPMVFMTLMVLMTLVVFMILMALVVLMTPMVSTSVRGPTPGVGMLRGAEPGRDGSRREEFQRFRVFWAPRGPKRG